MVCMFTNRHIEIAWVTSLRSVVVGRGLADGSALLILQLSVRVYYC